MVELKKKFKDAMLKYGYDISLSKNNHLSINTETETLSILDMKKINGGFSFIAVYNKKINGNLSEPLTKEFFVNFDYFPLSLNVFVIWLDMHTNLNNEHRRMEKEMFRKKVNKNAAFDAIVKYYANIDTLETRKSDNLDFHEISVWNLKSCMDEAYKLGLRVGKESNSNS